VAVDFNRESGVLLHPTSLPGPYGIGEIGPEAYTFVDKLAAMGQRLWQVLPIGPTSYGDSPYQSLSTFAGNHLLISFDLLVKDGLLDAAKLKTFPSFSDRAVDYGPVINARMNILHSVCRTFDRRASEALKNAFGRFCRKQAYWLDDYALFYAIKNAHDGRPWTDWEEPLALREEKAMAKATKKYAAAARCVKILQFLFARQWDQLRKYAHKKKIKIIGDIPIFVAHDSADVWAHRDLYYLDEHGQPTVIAGVPPDYFSATGQRWGNPLYRWDVHQATNFKWWVLRMKKILECVDLVRIDHFRGFEAYWEIPATEKTAIKGRWVEGPGQTIFDALKTQLGDLPIIAEDLGVITPGVEALRDHNKLPGMRILQFAFGNDAKADDYRPESYPPNCVVYTGTHDNDTTVGWFWSQAGANSTRSQEDIEKERAAILAYVHTDGAQIHWDMMSVGSRSRANTAVFPLQDLMGLGSEARMNVPGRESGNWQWRFAWDQLTPDIIQRMRELAKFAGRV